MIAGGSTYFLIACIVAGAMTLVGLGVLFVRAENVERPNLVAATTLICCFVAILLLWNASRNSIGVSDSVAWSSMAVSIFGFVVGRILDAILGGRRKVHHDQATLGSDLAD